MKIKTIVLALLILLSYSLYSQQRNVSRFLIEENLLMEYNPVTLTGQFIKGGHSVSFIVDSDIFVLDYSRQISSYKIVIINNALTIHKETEKLIKQYFESVQQENRSVAVILLDPGHGGKDPGAVGRFETKGDDFVIYEKNVVLNISLKLQALLQKQFPGKRIIMTRNNDTYLTLEERVEIANNVSLKEHEAILFISIHANAGLNKSIDGFEVWHLPVKYRRQVLSDEDKPENKEIIPILNTMLEEEYFTESVKLAALILDGMAKEISDLSENRGIKEESWFVVRKANMPSVLIESGFISNFEEAQRLNQDSYLNKISKGIYNGINDFISFFEGNDNNGNE